MHEIGVLISHYGFACKFEKNCQLNASLEAKSICELAIYANVAKDEN